MPIKNKEKQLKRFAKKLTDNPGNIIVLSKELNNIASFKNELYRNNANILDGRWILNYLIPEIVEYISKMQECAIEQQEISILVNDNSEVNLKNIVYLSKKVKRLNIVTNNMDKFKKIEEYLYNKLGIMITITNNKKKSLIKSNIIINIDFVEESINQYKLPIYSTIFNVNYHTKIYSKRFCGVNAHNCVISFPEKYNELLGQYNIIEEFEKNILYESMIYRKDSFENIRIEIEENNSKIEHLIGNNGKINESEYKVLH